jgi:hypothetical protein
MNVSVVVEQIDDAGYRATTVSPVPLVAEATTRQQVLDGIRELLRDKLAQVEIIQLQVPGRAGADDPWNGLVGTWAGRPDREQIEQNLRDYRREVDADPLRL